MVVEWGGSLSAEHGIGQLKLAELERLGDPVALGMMRAVKAALDPLGLLNPGKLVRPGELAGAAPTAGALAPQTPSA
jgi:FAD/FMN-containing dehydrogenase